MKTHNRGVAIILALFLGGLGIHRFYVGRMKSGLLYLLFFWTFIPGILALIQGISWVFMDEEKFQERYRYNSKPIKPKEPESQENSSSKMIN